jgi:hypothetical protein
LNIGPVDFPRCDASQCARYILKAARNESEEAHEAVMNLAGGHVARFGSCRFPSIEVHRVPATGPTTDWLHSIGMAVRFEKPDGTLTEWE